MAGPRSAGTTASSARSATTARRLPCAAGPAPCATAAQPGRLAWTRDGALGTSSSPAPGPRCQVSCHAPYRWEGRSGMPSSLYPPEQAYHGGIKSISPLQTFRAIPSWVHAAAGPRGAGSIAVQVLGDLYRASCVVFALLAWARASH